MHLHTRRLLQYAGADLDQMKTDTVELGFGKSGLLQIVHPERVQNLISQAVKEKPELIGLETGTRGPIAFKMHLVFLDPKLHLPAPAIDVFVHGFRTGTLQARHHKTDVGPFFVMFRFDNHPSGFFPYLGLIGKFAVAS